MLRQGASGQLGSGVTTFSKVPLEVVALKNKAVSRLVCVCVCVCVCACVRMCVCVCVCAYGGVSL